jgi:hypothetical protein
MAMSNKGAAVRRVGAEERIRQIRAEEAVCGRRKPAAGAREKPVTGAKGKPAAGVEVTVEEERATGEDVGAPRPQSKKKKSSRSTSLL